MKKRLSILFILSSVIALPSLAAVELSPDSSEVSVITDSLPDQNRFSTSELHLSVQDSIFVGSDNVPAVMDSLARVSLVEEARKTNDLIRFADGVRSEERRVGKERI